MRKGKPTRPEKKRTKSPSSPDALLRASRKAGATLSEEELKAVSGGFITGGTHIKKVDILA